MLDDDDVLDAYEREFDDAGEGPPTSHRRHGFWMVAVAIGLGAVVLMVEIFANRPLVNSISRTEHDLNVARARAERIFAAGGSFASADAAGLAATDAGLTYVGADQPATTPGTVSVYATSDTWAAAARTQQGTCFYLKLAADRDPRYLVADGSCTGTEALRADQGEW